MANASKIRELQNKIIQLRMDLSEINKDEKPLPEFIDTTNMLRTNEYLQKATSVKSQLLSAYEEYTNELEILISSISKIKGDISSLNSRLKSRKSSRKKSKKRLRKKRVKRKNNKRKLKTRRKKTKHHR